MAGERKGEERKEGDVVETARKNEEKGPVITMLACVRLSFRPREGVSLEERKEGRTEGGGGREKTNWRRRKWW